METIWIQLFFICLWTSRIILLTEIKFLLILSKVWAQRIFVLLFMNKRKYSQNIKYSTNQIWNLFIH
jgi:hypothetical protein